MNIPPNRLKAPTLSLGRIGAGLGAMVVALCLAGCGADNPTSPGGKTLRAGARPATNGSATAAKAGPESASRTKSVFHTNPQYGRDPFFPGASRVTARAAEPQVVQMLPVASYLRLAGIRTGTSRPLALINRTTFGPGQQGDVSIVVSNALGRLETRKINVRCLEIRRDSVLLSIAGEKGIKELRMAQGK